MWRFNGYFQLFIILIRNFKEGSQIGALLMTCLIAAVGGYASGTEYVDYLI